MAVSANPASRILSRNLLWLRGALPRTPCETKAATVSAELTIIQSAEIALYDKAFQMVGDQAVDEPMPAARATITAAMALRWPGHGWGTVTAGRRGRRATNESSPLVGCCCAVCPAGRINRDRSWPTAAPRHHEKFSAPATAEQLRPVVLDPDPGLQ